MSCNGLITVFSLFISHSDIHWFVGRICESLRILLVSLYICLKGLKMEQYDSDYGTGWLKINKSVNIFFCSQNAS